MNYEISIIIPVFNVDKYIKESLECIKKQTIGFKNLEVIMVNDCSTDTSGEIIDEYAHIHNNFKAIHLEENSGSPGKPRNVGIDNARGDYLMFLDPDDYYNKDACEILYNKIKFHDADIVSSRYKSVLSDGTIIQKNPNLFGDLTEVKVKSKEDIKKLLKVGPTIWTKIYKRSFIINNNIKFPEFMWAEDLAFDVQTILKAEKIIHLNNYFSYNYRLRDQTCESTSFSFTRNKKTLSSTTLGYKYTNNILKEIEKEEYFSTIFDGHLRYWINQFIRSDTTIDEKKDLLNEIFSLFKKYRCRISEIENPYTPIFNTIAQNDFENAILISEVFKNYIKNEERLEQIIASLNKDLTILKTQINANEKINNMLKLENQEFKSEKTDLEKKLAQKKDEIRKQNEKIAKLQSFKGYFSYKTKNITSRLKKKIINNK